MRFNHVARFIVNANHRIVRSVVELRVADCIGDCVWLKPVGTDVRKPGYLPFVWLRANERESATRKYGQHLVAPRNEIGRIVKGKLGMLFRGFVLFARNAGGKFGKVLKEKSGMLFRRFVLFARNWGGQFGKVVKEKLVMLFHRFVLFAGNVGRSRQNDNKGKPRPKFEWPYVMDFSVAMRGPLASGTWIWHRQHARWHHGYYRTRR